MVQWVWSFSYARGKNCRDLLYKNVDIIHNTYCTLKMVRVNLHYVFFTTINNKQVVDS